MDAVPYERFPFPPDAPMTIEESGIIDTAVQILPHLGPDATVAFLARAGEANRHEGENTND